MNNKIKELAEQAGFIPGIMGLNRFTYFDPEKFAELVRADEREACLKAVERAKMHQFILYPKGASIDANKVGEIYAHQHKECIEAIRARGEK